MRTLETKCQQEIGKKTLADALPELREIAKTLGTKTNDPAVLKKYFERRSEK